MVIERAEDPVDTHKLGAGRVYRDDLEQIVKLLSEIGLTRIEIQGANGFWVADTADDFSHPDIPPRLERVTMTGRSASDGQAVQVELSRRGSKIAITAPSTLTSGVHSGLTKILRPRLDDYLVPRLVMTRLAWPLVVGSSVLWLTYAILEKWSAAWFFAVLAFASGLGIADYAVAKRGDVTVINDYRTHSFLARTKDDWVVGIASMLIGLVLGYLLARATGASQ